MNAIKHLWEAPFHLRRESFIIRRKTLNFKTTLILTYKRWIEDKFEATQTCERQTEFYLELYQNLKQDEKVLKKECPQRVGSSWKRKGSFELSIQKNTKDRLQGLENIISCIKLTMAPSLEMAGRRLSSQRGSRVVSRPATLAKTRHTG